MCTVSFINTNNEIIITSNRDEKVVRPSAIPPKNYVKNGKNIIFQKTKKQEEPGLQLMQMEQFWYF
jgi:hypothetical protein